ncbi:MAG: sigma-54 interaction domain-containing protein [Planctomycetota bacterium]|jgi:DNA-binding NtrC family response regulator
MSLENILVVGRDYKTQQLARPFTKQLFSADDTDDTWQMIDSVQPHLIIFGSEIGHEQLCSFLETKGKKAIDTPVVIIGDKNNHQYADQLISLGAYDYIKGEKEHPRLSHVIERIKTSDKKDDDDRAKFFSEDCPSSVSIVGRSDSTLNTLKTIRLVANSSCNPVLIVGETGTGKELAAKAVHILRHGADKKFVAINCAALTANLLESELFGHVKGSFTSADREKTGLLELAADGSIFLDEINAMPGELQAKLLRVLQEKTFRKVGGIKEIQCKATIIASSNKRLAEQAKKGTFRSDLYYRLAICPIALAPLRAKSRKEDILLLAEYFIQNSTVCPDKVGKITGLTKLAAQALQNHNWPGNIRELRNVIERAMLLESSSKIGLSNLILNPEQLAQDDTEPKAVGFSDFSLERAEKELISKALTEAGWQKTRAAAMLGITRATLYAKVKQYKILQPAPQPATVTA